MWIFWLPFAACYYYCIYPHKESENNIYRKNSPNANGFKIIDGKTQKSYAHTFNVKCRKGRYRWKESKTKKKTFEENHQAHFHTNRRCRISLSKQRPVLYYSASGFFLMRFFVVWLCTLPCATFAIGTTFEDKY